MKKQFFYFAIFLASLNVNYSQTYTVESIPYNVPVDVNVIDHSYNLDDQWSPTVNLPFSFNFFGTDYTQFILSTNGALSFDIVNSGNYHFWTPAEGNTLPNNIDAALKDGNIFFAIHDLYPNSSSGGTGWQVFGSAPNRMFVISFLEVSQFACSGLLTTQALVLYETTNVIEVYILDKPVCSTWAGGRAALGIQNNAGTEAYVPEGRNTGVWTAQMEAWRFSPESLSVNKISDFQIEIFPNPVADFLNIEVETNISGILEVEIIDLQGKLILRQDLEGTTLDVSYLNPGVYFLNLKTENNTEKVFKLVKK